jgi:hypothetical protein
MWTSVILVIPSAQEFCRRSPKLPEGGAGVPDKVQATRRTSIPDWFVYSTKLQTIQLTALFIVKPDATAEEVNAVVNDTNGSGGQIFAQAVCLLCHNG